MSLFLLGTDNRVYVICDIYERIQEASDKKLQMRGWIEGSIPNYFSSYSELICSLFDDRNFDFFVDNDVARLKFGEELIQELQIFHVSVLVMVVQR